MWNNWCKFFITLSMLCIGCVIIHSEGKRYFETFTGRIAEDELKDKDAPFEIINGIVVFWNGATRNQKVLIHELLNNMMPVKGGTYNVKYYTPESRINLSSNTFRIEATEFDNFLIDSSLVSQNLWMSVMGYNPSDPEVGNSPVDQMSWYKCQEFLYKLNLITGLNFRLPTEQEWDLAVSQNIITPGINEWTSTKHVHVDISQVEYLRCIIRGEKRLMSDPYSRNKDRGMRLVLTTKSSSGFLSTAREREKNSKEKKKELDKKKKNPKKEELLMWVEESINNMKVIWNGVDNEQKAEIIKLINDLVRVEGIENYYMMSDKYRYKKIKLNSFLIGKYEIPQSTWYAVMGYNPSAFKSENLPVESVSWYECQNFINRLNLMTGLKFQLPSEAQWEYVAQNNTIPTKKTTNRASGNNPNKPKGWVAYTTRFPASQPIGTSLPNTVGVYDMFGNVSEWTSDYWSGATAGGEAHIYYTYRGSSWRDTEHGFDPNFRDKDVPTNCSSQIGFRVILHL